MEIAKLVLEFSRVSLWPIVALVVLYVFYKDIRSLVARITKASGWGIVLETELAQAKRSSEATEAEAKARGRKKPERLEIALTDMNKKLVEHGFLPSPSGLNFSVYREQAETDPVVGIVGLRAEIEYALRNLAKAYNVAFDARSSLSSIAERLLLGEHKRIISTTWCCILSKYATS